MSFESHSNADNYREGAASLNSVPTNVGKVEKSSFWRWQMTGRQNGCSFRCWQMVGGNNGVSFDADKWQEVFGIFIRPPTASGKVYRDAFCSRRMSVGFLHWGLHHKYAFALTQRSKEHSDLPTNNVRSSNASYKKGRLLRGVLI